MSNNLNITPQLALTAARVLKDFCNQQGDNCIKCPFIFVINCLDMIPAEWELPEREIQNE